MKKLFAIFELAWGKTPMPSLWGKANTNFDYVLLAVGKTPTPEWRGRFRNKFMPLIIYLLWPLRAPILIWQYTYKYGSSASKNGAPSILRQIYDQLTLSILKRVSPEQYYSYRLFEDNGMNHAKYFLQPNVSASLNRLINEKDGAFVEDKFEICKKLSRNNIPTTQTLAVARNGEIEFQEANSSSLIQEDMIIKPNDGIQGEGVCYIQFISKNKYKMEGTFYDGKEIIEHIINLSANRTYLLQRCLKNHALITSLAPKAVSTIRLMTGLRPNGNIDKVYAVIKIPSHDQVTDNFATGGLAASIDIDTGRVGKAITKHILARPVKNNPITGNKIEGLVLPYWRETIDIGLRSHKLFPGYVFLGWDIAITDDGPVILETNAMWCTRIVQTPEPFPLGSTLLAEIAKEWIILKRYN